MAFLDFSGLSRFKSKVVALIPSASSTTPGNVSSASSRGTSSNYARQDHTHGISVGTGDANGQVKVAGQNASVKGLSSAAFKSSESFAPSQYAELHHANNKAQTFTATASKVEDMSGFVSSSEYFTITNNGIKINKAGYYLIMAHFNVKAGSAKTVWTLAVHSLILGSYIAKGVQACAATDNAQLSCSVIYNCGVDEEISAYIAGAGTIPSNSDSVALNKLTVIAL